MHRTLHKAALAVALSLTLSVPPTFAAEPQAADASAEQSVTSPRGRATFLLPAGWGKVVQGNAVIITPPEADGSRSAIVDAAAATPDEAVAEAWKVLGLNPKFLLATDAAPRDGWDQRRFYDYDVPANAKRVVNASAFRKGTSWTVVVADVDQAIAEKRASQYGKIGGAAQRRFPVGSGGAVLHHVTMAYDIDAAKMSRVLNTSREKMSDKAVKSAVKRVDPMKSQTGLSREHIVEHLIDWFAA